MPFFMLAGEVNARVAALADLIPSGPFFNNLFEINDDSVSHFDKFLYL